MTELKKKYGPMCTFFDYDSYKILKELSQPEKMFAYFMSMAGIMGIQISLFQRSPHPKILDKITTYLLSKDSVKNDIYEEMKIYFLYLFSNYGVHGVHVKDNNKLVPSDLSLDLTAKSFEEVGIILTSNEEKYLFDKNYFPTSTVSNLIENSGSHFYGRDMTTSLHNKLPDELKTKINGYYDNDFNSYYSTTTVCAESMSRCVYWFEKALEVAKNNTDYFDSHTVKSLELLIKYYHSGDEKDFREHSKEWLQMNNPRIEYTNGFIEHYEDPMENIGSYRSDLTIKCSDINPLLKLLLCLEDNLPFPREWKRKNMNSLPNASVVYKIMATGGLGPIRKTSAYCLPNYKDIRSEYGSKQIIYAYGSSVSDAKTDHYKKIYISEQYHNILDKYSPDLKLIDSIERFTTILHETIGHASGDNKIDRIGKWKNGFEEMRAEIIALYTGIFFYDQIIESGILDNWPKIIPKKIMLELQIQKIAGNGWKRWTSVPENCMDVKEAHALADTGIMYYLIDHSMNGIELIEKEIHGTKVLQLVIHELEKVLPVIKELAILVQELSSNGDSEKIGKFMIKYAVSTRNKNYSKIVKSMGNSNNKKTNIKIQIFPEWTVCDNKYEPVIPLDPINATLKIWQLTNK